MASLVDGLHRRAIEALRQNLAADEQVLAVVNGARRSAIIATDRRIFVFKTGAAAGATFGSKFSSFAYGNINGVELHTGMSTGSVVLDVAGAAPVGSSYWGNSNNDPWKAQNAIPIANRKQAQAEVPRLRELIARWHERDQDRPGTRSSSGSQGDAILAQIKQLGELRDQGILTAAEFETKKAELLARL